MPSIRFNRMILFFLFVFVGGQLEDEFNKVIDELQTVPATPAGNDDTTPLSLDPVDSGNSQGIENRDPFSVPQQGNNCEHECVPFYQCVNGTLNTGGINIIDIRTKDSCGNPLLTCCKNNQISKERFTTPTPEVPPPKGCGYRRTNGVGFQITGAKENEAQYAEFPWMVSVFSTEAAVNGQHGCGGALVHPQAVITAAHCVSDSKMRYKIRAGEWDIAKTIEPFPVQEVSVEKVTIHREYYAGALFNDIAFLKLSSPVKLSENIDTICLPQQNLKHKSNARCFSTGWGKNKFGKDGTYQIIMKKIDLPVVSKKKCQEDMRKTRLGPHFELHHSFMCAGGEKGKDACKGDGGSPLVCPMGEEKERYYHAGIVAWGIGCGEKNIPGVYVDVAEFRNWIDSLMKKFRLPTSYYDKVEPRK